MSHKESPADLGIADRLRRTRNRPARRTVVSTKVTQDEQEQMEIVAKAQGKVISEWAREVLLREAAGGFTDRAILTELIALRLLMNGVLRTVAVGETLSKDQYQALLAEVRNTKHDAAQDTLTQYQPQQLGGK